MNGCCAPDSSLPWRPSSMTTGAAGPGHRARRIAVLAGGVLSVTALPALASPPACQASLFCESDQAPRFVLGFAACARASAMPWASRLNVSMLSLAVVTRFNTRRGPVLLPLEYQHAHVHGRFNHWALTTHGLVSWTGSSIEPPGVLVPAADATRLPTQTPTAPLATATTLAVTAAPTAVADSPTVTPEPVTRLRPRRPYSRRRPLRPRSDRVAIPSVAVPLAN